MRHKLCRSFHPWCPGVKNRCLFLIIREPGYWYQQPLSDYKKCQIAVCSSVAYGTHWDPQWQPDTTGVVITPLQQIHIDNRGQPACGSLMGLGWGCPIDWWPFTVWPGSPRGMPHQDLCPSNATQPAPGLAAANRGRDGTRPHRLLIGIALCGIDLNDTYLTLNNTEYQQNNKKYHRLDLWKITRNTHTYYIVY